MDHGVDALQSVQAGGGRSGVAADEFRAVQSRGGRSDIGHADGEARREERPANGPATIAGCASDQVETFFSILAGRAIRRGSFRGVTDSMSAIKHFVDYYK